MAVDLDLATVNPTEKHVITKLLRQEKQLQRSHGSTAEQRVLRDIKRKIKENNLIITRADKEKKRSKAVISLAYQGHVLDPTSVNNKRWARIPYLGDLSYKCSRTLAGCNPAFYTTRNLSSMLCNSKDHTDINQRSGVYELTCATCNKKYIGQTGRSFRIRVAEHSSGWRLNKTESNFAEHLITENHKFDPHENFKALHFCDKGRRLTALETLEINKVISHSRDNILNQQLELSRSPLLHYFE
ncbi:hypothetical protein ACJJTC_009973 [Scirpophaga incertulas]